MDLERYYHKEKRQDWTYHCCKFVYWVDWEKCWFLFVYLLILLTFQYECASVVCLLVLGTSWCMERRRWRGLCGYICGTLWINYKNERQPYRWYIIHNNKEWGRICLVASEIISNEFTFHERWNDESNDRVGACIAWVVFVCASVVGFSWVLLIDC